MSLFLSVVIAIIVFGAIIMIHELGHFIAARLNGITVVEFAMGMGPALVKIQRPETLFTIRAFPIGGYCKMLGEDEKADAPGAYCNKKVWRRFIVSIAGAAMNFLLALAIAVIVCMFNYTYTNVIGKVNEGSPAAAAGFMAGDKLVSVNGAKTHIFEQFWFYANIDNGKPADITVRRGSELITRRIEPKLISQPDDRNKLYDTGIVPRAKYGLLQAREGGGAVTGPFESLSYSYWTVVHYGESTLAVLGRLITGRLGVENVVGVVGATEAIKDVVDTVAADEKASLGTKAAEIIAFGAQFCVIISVNVGVFNLLPLPALDGGRCVFHIIEAVRRKPMDPNKEGLVHVVGFALLMVFAAFITLKDIFALF